MKRLLAALLALSLCLDTAAARVLVVVPRGSDDTSLEPQNTHALRAVILGMLNRAGVQYDMDTRPKTEFCRLGIRTWNFGDAGAYNTTYEAVIHVLNNNANTHGNGYRPDSLFSSTKMPRVPQLFFTNSYSSWSASCTCSLGINVSGAGYNANTNYIGWTQRYREAEDLRYRSGFTDGMAATTSKHGTVRMLVSGGSNVAHAQTNRPTVPLPCIDCDSLLAPTPDDSGVVIIHHNDHGVAVNGWKPNIICSVSHNANDQNDIATGIIGLAVLDSVCGGTIIKKPFQFSINIRGGFRRNSRVTRGGISPNDSTVLKASIDSLASLNVPFTVGVNIDSVGTYDSEKFWWQRAPRAKFAPESWLGVNDTTAVQSTGGRANAGASVDIWGRFRSRIMFGDGSGIGADTSFSAMLKQSMTRCDSIFPGKLDQVGLAPAFDWAPRNIGSVGLDSLWYAMQIGGVLAVVTEPQNALSNPSQSQNPRGWIPQQGRWKSRYGGETIRILATPQSPDSGSVAFDSGHTTDSFLNSPANSWVKNAESFWDGMVGMQMIATGRANAHLADAGPGGPEPQAPTNNFSNASVLTIHAGDLGSGSRADAATRPTRNGWWTIKSVVNQAKIANLCANRKVVIIKYTQDVEP